MPAYKGTKQIRRGKAPPTPSQSQAALQAALKAAEENRRLGITPRMAKGGVTKEMPSADQMGSLNMKKGGKVKPKTMGKSDKAGRALVKKSADTMGRAMVKKYAKGGMIEKEGMNPKGKMDKKKAFLEMIARLKAKKK